jgi:hypothetical protein
MRTRSRESSLTNPVRKPSIKECLVGRPAFGETQVALALKRFQCAQQYGFAVPLPASLEEGIERSERLLAHPPVRRQVALVLSDAIEGGQSALEEGHRHRRSHVHPRVEQLSGKPRTASCDLVKVRA